MTTGASRLGNLLFFVLLACVAVGAYFLPRLITGTDALEVSIIGKPPLENNHNVVYRNLVWGETPKNSPYILVDASRLDDPGAMQSMGQWISEKRTILVFGETINPELVVQMMGGKIPVADISAKTDETLVVYGAHYLKEENRYIPVFLKATSVNYLGGKVQSFLLSLHDLENEDTKK